MVNTKALYNSHEFVNERMLPNYLPVIHRQIDLLEDFPTDYRVGDVAYATLIISEDESVACIPHDAGIIPLLQTKIMAGILAIYDLFGIDNGIIYSTQESERLVDPRFTLTIDPWRKIRLIGQREAFCADLKLTRIR